MRDRLTRLNFMILLLVILYTVVIIRFITAHPVVNGWVDSIFAFLTSIGFYRLLIHLIYDLVGKSRTLLRLYWGELFIDGFWSYRYTLDQETDNGEKDDRVYFGLWRFKQTLYDTKAVGFGLNDDFSVRSRIRSVTDMLGQDPMYEFINIRSDSVDSANEYYSRTNMYFELSKSKFFRYPIRMRGKTVMYGGPLTGRICNNLFVRHELAQTEQDVIDDLRELARQHGGTLSPP